MFEFAYRAAKITKLSRLEAFAHRNCLQAESRWERRLCGRLGRGSRSWHTVMTLMLGRRTRHMGGQAP